MSPCETTGLVRVFFVCAGLVFVGIAYLGAILPGLPTTPWLIAASYCFGRSSPRLHRWLLRSPFFGQLLQDWHTHRGIRKPTKMIACAVVILACTASITLASLSSSWRWLIAGLGTTGLCVILFLIPTIRPGAGPDPLP